VAARRRVAAAEADLRDPADPCWLLDRGRRRDLHGRRRHPDDVRAGTKTLVGPRSSSTRTGVGAPRRELEADLFVMATDVDGVYRDWGQPTQARIEQATTSELAGSRSPPARWARRSRRAADFAEQTGNRAAIGTLAEVGGLVAGTHGTSSSVAAPVRRTLRRDRGRAPDVAADARESLLAIAILIVLITLTVALFVTDATGRSRSRSQLLLAALGPGPRSWATRQHERRGDRGTRRSGGVSSAMARSTSCSRSAPDSGPWNMAGTDPDDRLLRDRRSSCRTSSTSALPSSAAFVGLSIGQLVDDRPPDPRRRLVALAPARGRPSVITGRRGDLRRVSSCDKMTRSRETTVSSRRWSAG
jgi:hypothetical protein